MKNFLKSLNFIIIIFIFIIFTNIVFAQQTGPGLEEQITANLNQAGVEAGYGESTAQTPSSVGYFIGTLISYILGFIGVIFLIITIYSGFQWMTAGGNEETITKAKKRIINSVIGLIIIFTAYLITYFITEVLITTTGYE